MASHGADAGPGGAAAGPPDPSGAAGVRWNLGELYHDATDQALAADAADARRRAADFAARWRGRLATMTAAELRAALAEYEAVQELGERPGFYASLLAAAQSDDPVALDLEQRTTEEQAELRTTLIFFELELLALPAERFAALAGDPALADYAHFLHALRRFQPHVLTEPEERVLARKDVAGRAAFTQLYDELASSLRFQVEIDGAARVLTDGEALALLHHPQRALRQHALGEFLAVHDAHRLPLAAIFNALVLDHRIDCDLRGYGDPAAPTHLANEIPASVVATMMDAVERHYPVIQEFFRLKARLLGLPRLGSADLYAPLGATAEVVPYPAAGRLVLDAFARFSPEFAATARRFFDERWIDAEVRPGKRQGAFCASLGPAHHPYVLASYAGTTRDVATLAHELGHGVHYLLARAQTFLNYDPPLVLAETASVFAEMVVTDHLLERAPDATTRRRILVETLDEMYATVFRQHALTRFELAAHAARRQHRLSADDLADLWWREQERLFGDAVEIAPAYRVAWSAIPHFIHSRFYCYAYAFGELLTLALFQRWRAQGAAFLPDYLRLLASGGGTEPAVLLATVGIDVASATFWTGGCAAIAALVDELRRTI